MWRRTRARAPAPPCRGSASRSPPPPAAPAGSELVEGRRASPAAPRLFCGSALRRSVERGGSSESVDRATSKKIAGMITSAQNRRIAMDITYGGDGRTVMRLLIIEDDRDAADYLAKAFREVGHVADLAADGEEGLAHALDGQYDVLIVDRMLPKLDGLAVIGSLRSKGIETPALILSALGQVDDRVKGLRAGGDDYLPKPYSLPEPLARVEVLARRRSGRGEETTYRVGDLELDRLSHRVTRGDAEIVLQPREFRLLEYLMKHAGQVVTRTMLLENVWDYHLD